MSATRKQIIAALKTLIVNTGAFPTVGTRLVLWNKISDGFPCAFIRQVRDHYPQRLAQAFPAKVTLDVEVWIYSDAGEDPDAVPEDTLRDLIDTLEAALQPQPGGLDFIQQKQTLGGVVDRCWIEGEIEYYPSDTDQKAKAIVPLKILTT